MDRQNDHKKLFILQDGSKEEGKYKNNILITSNKKKHVFLIRSAKFRERIEAAVAAAQRAAKIAMQKEDIAISRQEPFYSHLKYKAFCRRIKNSYPIFPYV